MENSDDSGYNNISNISKECVQANIANFCNYPSLYMVFLSSVQDVLTCECEYGCFWKRLEGKWNSVLKDIEINRNDMKNGLLVESKALNWIPGSLEHQEISINNFLLGEDELKIMLSDVIGYVENFDKESIGNIDFDRKKDWIESPEEHTKTWHDVFDVFLKELKGLRIEALKDRIMTSVPFDSFIKYSAELKQQIDERIIILENNEKKMQEERDEKNRIDHYTFEKNNDTIHSPLSTLSSPFLSPTSSDSENAWQRRSSIGSRFYDNRNWKRLVLYNLRELTSHKGSFIFNSPVNTAEAPLYYETIKKPMCFSMIKNRIRENVLRTTNEVHRDLLLMFQNALIYNGSGSEIYEVAMEMMIVLDRVIDNIKKSEKT